MRSFSGLSIGFLLCVSRTARQQSWLPGSGVPRYSSSSGKLPVVEVVQHPPLAGPGARSARKMIQWIIFSEGGPEGHGRYYLPGEEYEGE